MERQSFESGTIQKIVDEQTMKLKMKTSEVFEVILWAIMIVHLELPWWVWGIWLLTIFGVHIEYPKGDSE